jgi:hypothetical protein
MKRSITFLLCCLATSLCAGELDIGGYFEPQMAGYVVQDRYYNIAANKLRVDLSRKLADAVQFGANFDYIAYHGKTSWNLLDYLPDDLTAAIPQNMRPYFTYTFGDMVQAVGPVFTARPDRIFLDNAYARLSFGKIDMTVGRQQISMGPGYTWNPTDLFNTKNVLDPTYEQPGHNALRTDVALSPNTSMVLLFAPESEWRDSAKLIKLKGLLGHFDWSLIAVRRYWQFTDYLTFLPSQYERSFVGGDFNGQLFGMGLWGEGGYHFMKQKEGPGLAAVTDHAEFLLGLDYTWKSGLYFMAEYYQNDMAPANWRRYTINNWMWMLSAEMKTLGRQQTNILLQYPLTDLVTIGMSTVACLNDGSAVFVPMLLYSLFEDVELSLWGNVYFGEEGKAYAGSLGNGALARLRVYF